MGTRGPVKAPPQLQLVRGDPRQRGKAALVALADGQVNPEVAIPALPEHFAPPRQLLELPSGIRAERDLGSVIAAEARAEWERITPHLARLGLISEIDRAAITGYCFWWAVSVIAQRKMMELGEGALVKNTPSGFEQMSAWMLAASKASAELKPYLAQFGLSPAARARVQAGDPQGSLPGVEAKPQEGGWGHFK